MVTTTRQAAPRKAPTKAKKAVAPSVAPAKPPVTAPTADTQAAAKGKRVQRTAVKPVQTASTKTTAPKADKKAKAEKIKVVRDSFTIPKFEYAQIADMKKRAMALGKEAKKSELIRAGLALLAATSDAAFSKALASVPTLKTGRPGKA